MKKVFMVALVVLAASFMQSCKRSNDAIAKDYCEKLKEGLEKRDFESVEKAKEALDKYCSKLSDEEIENMMKSLEKYVKELKVDSVYVVCLREMSAGGQDETLGAPSDDAVSSCAEGNAMPDTLRF